MTTVEASSEQPGRSRAMGALAALWLLLALGIVLPSVAPVDRTRGPADTAQIAVDRLRAAIAVDAAGATAEDGARLDDGPDGEPVAPVDDALRPEATGRSATNSPRQASNLGRDRASPFEARAPPLA